MTRRTSNAKTKEVKKKTSTADKLIKILRAQPELKIGPKDRIERIRSSWQQKAWGAYGWKVYGPKMCRNIGGQYPMKDYLKAKNIKINLEGRSFHPDIYLVPEPDPGLPHNL